MKILERLLTLLWLTLMVFLIINSMGELKDTIRISFLIGAIMTILYEIREQLEILIQKKNDDPKI